MNQRQLCGNTQAEIDRDQNAKESLIREQDRESDGHPTFYVGSELEKQDAIKDALKPGDFFTVKRWGNERDNHYLKGECLEVVVINYPFVRAKQHCTSSIYEGVRTIDLRRADIMPLDDDYIKTFKSGG